ncbi:putative late blight resistance protein homolog R1A-3 [Henckelia pumila]|uniref:putative late blight resistance protein homolog R1A-3 n=1 Tax=Henckelia pumila TaxID=405737 RepID=UPI003C6E0911
MAYAAIISLQLTLQNILLHPHIYSLPCKKKDIESLYEKLEFLQRFLEEYNPSHESNERATLLEGRIRDAAYEAEDLMDLHSNNLSDSNHDFRPFASETRDYLMHLVAAFRNDTYKLFPYKKAMMGRINIELMIKKVDSIIGEATKIKEKMGLEIIEVKGSFMQEEIMCKDYSSKFVSSTTENFMVGFEDHLMRIKDQLTGQSSALKVIPIVGMGGIGKTTLATHVYNDPYVVYQFNIRAWATVSQSYSVREILLDMLGSMNKLTEEMQRESEDRLGLHVYQNLKGQRYLITIDDIWDINAWDALKMMFPDDKAGSRIMLTTRIADVAVYASPSRTLHQISLLSDDQSWMLLCAKVFGNEPCPIHLKEIGKTIAHNCRGLPLSIVVIGGLLSRIKKTRVAWQSIAKNVSSLVSTSADQCSDILRLSYNYLPQYLKACFLYMGVFPKAYEISVSKLTKIWAAEGFLRQVRGQSPEEVAERCVEDLVDRSLILVSKKNSKGRIKTFRIHDILLDFCLKEAKNEKFLQITRSSASLFPPGSTSERRISIHPMRKAKHILLIPDFLSCTPSVRSLVCVGQSFIGSSVFSRLKLLRVLDATQVEFTEFPSQVLELLNLRYIALICNGDIPASITKLWNLQTLIILRKSKEYRESHLPVGIWIMTHLRHVKCYGARLLDPVLAKFDFCGNRLVLEDLQTVSGLCNLRFTEEMLQSIPNITKVDVLYDSRSFGEKNWSDYELENLAYLHQLQALKIRVIPSKGLYKNLISQSMFKFHFPPSLKTLTLGGVGIPWHDLAIIGSLPNLEVLKLIEHACLGAEWEPNEDEFCKLKVLVLQSVSLRHWRGDWNHFPSLERLVVRWCSRLIKIPSGIGESPTLAMIELEGCKDSVLDSANEILEKQQSYGNDCFRVLYHKRSVWQNLSKEVDNFLPSTSRLMDLFWPPPLFVMRW